MAQLLYKSEIKFSKSQALKGIKALYILLHCSPAGSSSWSVPVKYGVGCSSLAYMTDGFPSESYLGGGQIKLEEIFLSLRLPAKID